MEAGPVVLLGQGEQYADPDDWRELIRARRIRRGVELPVRRDGLTTLRRPEDVPELAAVLDRLDPPETPGETPTRARPPAPTPPRPAVPLSPPLVAASPPAAAARPALPTAAPRRRRSYGPWLWVFAVGVLLLIRLCAGDGLPSLPSFGARADEGAEYAPGGEGRRACARIHGWIARAACEDPAFARLRPELAQAYAARLAAAPAAERASVTEEQQRWSAGRGACRTETAPGACLARLYRQRLGELQDGARADARAAPPGERPPPAASRTAVASVERPQWVRRPGADEFADAYPERALRQEVEGRALLSCRATAAGGLTACDVVSEDPPEFGFGGAALRLSRFYQMRPLTADGRPVEGARVDVPVAFRPA